MTGLIVQNVRRVAIATVIVFGLFSPSGVHAEHRLALLIGNSAFEGNSPLISPRHNIKAVAGVLQRHGFRTVIAADLDRAEIYDEVEKHIKSAPINGTSLLYFSGHVATEVSDAGSNVPILLGVDGKRNGVPLNELVTWIHMSSATAQNVIILDPYLLNTGQSSDSRRPGIPPLEFNLPDIWLGYAAGTGETIKSTNQRYSKFATEISRSKESDLEKLLTNTCSWKKSTCGKQPFAEPATIAVASPDRFLTSANPGDEWVAGDGTVFCWCPPGSGDGFWIGKYEVVLCKWQFPGLNAGSGRFRNLPTTQLDTADIQTQLAATTQKERGAGRLPNDWEYSLPSPQQWEHAARAGSKNARYFEDSELVRHVNFADKSLFDTQDDVYLYANSALNDGTARLAPVGSYLPNAWGLHDVYGNVWEQTDTGVLCGGSWVSLPIYCRADVRKPPIHSRSDFVGLRLVVRPVSRNGIN